MYYYNIEIKVEPEIFNNNHMYFWCITKNTKDGSSNSGHGWSVSVEQSASDAFAYYNKNIINQT